MANMMRGISTPWADPARPYRRIEVYTKKRGYRWDKCLLSLRELAEAALAGSLGKLATDGTYSCGGDLELPQAIDVVYNVQANEMNRTFQGGPIVFPGADEASLSALVGSSTPRDCQGTYQLERGSFFTSFQLCSTTILNEIENVMHPGKRIRADLDKLDVRTAGSDLETRINTGRSSEVTEFGKLVVCLPTKFIGGTMVTHHHGNKVEYNWSKSSCVIHWAAFLSDTKLEFFPVTSGYCITLTYKLYAAEDKLVSRPEGNPFCKFLHRAISHPHFMRGGGSLGFQCQHAYQYTSLNLEERLPVLLKGADSVVFSAAKSMGLNVRIKPLVEGYKHWYLMAGFPGVVCGFHNPELEYGGDNECPIDVEMQALGAEVDDLKPDSYSDKRWHRVPRQRANPITWCTIVQPDQIAGYYLDFKRRCDCLFQAAVIVVDIPSWGDRSDAGNSPPSKGRKRPSDTPTVELERDVFFWTKEEYMNQSQEDLFWW